MLKISEIKNNIKLHSIDMSKYFYIIFLSWINNLDPIRRFNKQINTEYSIPCKSLFMNTIKILYPYLGFYRDAGGEHSPLALAEELDRDRFTFEIVTLEPNTSTIWAAVKNSGCTVHELDTGIPRLKEPVAMIKTIFIYYDMFRRLKPDIVQTQSGFCNQWARLAAIAARVPAVIVTVNYDEPEPKWYLGPFLRRLDRWLARGTDAYVCIASHLMEQQVPVGFRDRSVIIPQFFDIDRFVGGRADLPAIDAFSDPARPILGFVGRLEPEKGISIAIAAMRGIVDAVPGARLRIIGTGSLESDLKIQVTELGLTDHIEFVGHRTDICDQMAAMDLLLIPSYNEAFGLVVLESIAAGVPLLGSRSGAFPEILEDGKYGTLADPDAPDAWAETAIDLIGDPSPALAKLEKARAEVLGRYTRSASVRQHAALYERLLERSKKRR